MSFSASNLTRRNGVYYFRARVPAEYISAFGRSMVSISLQTSDEVEARLRAGVHRRDLDLALKALGQEKREVSAGYTGPLLHLTDADIEHICKCYRASKLAQDELERIAGFTEDSFQLDIDIMTDGVGVLRQAFARGDLKDAYVSLRMYLQKHGPRVLPGTPLYERLVRAFQVAEIEVSEAILQRRLGKSVAIPLAPTGGETYETVFARWKARKEKPNLKTVASFKHAYAVMREICTAISPSMLTKADGIHFRDTLIERGKVSRATIVKMLGFLRAIFECSVDDDKLRINPFKKVEVQIDEVLRVQKSRLPFPLKHLRTIFSSRLYQPGYTPPPGLGKACHWLPPLSLLSGARLEELAQMHAEDVCFDSTLDVWYLAIHAEGKRQVKNASSIRNVPVHAELVKLGFLDFVASVKTGRLFPALTPDTYGKLGTVFSTWFGRYLDELQIISPQLVYHSFRHNFLQICKQQASLIPPEVREATVGHLSPKSIAATYGEPMYPLRPMAEAMKHVVYDIDFSLLYPTKPKKAKAIESATN